MITGFQLCFRLVLGVLGTWVWIFVLKRWFGFSLDPMDFSSLSIQFTGWASLILFWLMILGLPLIRWISERVGGLFMPSDAGMDYKPEYSLAEARVQEGEYEEAVELFRKYAEQFPNEITPHLRIADLMTKHLDKQDAAISELKRALAKTKSAEPFALVSFRLAEIYISYAEDFRAALHCYHDIQRKFPGTRQCRAAVERAEQLLKTKQMKESGNF